MQPFSVEVLTYTKSEALSVPIQRGKFYGLVVVVVEELAVLSVVIPVSISFFTPSLASLNSRIPLPRPRASSGILRPPKKITTASSNHNHSPPPGIDIRRVGLTFSIVIGLEFYMRR